MGRGWHTGGRRRTGQPVQRWSNEGLKTCCLGGTPLQCGHFNLHWKWKRYINEHDVDWCQKQIKLLLYIFSKQNWYPSKQNFTYHLLFFCNMYFPFFKKNGDRFYLVTRSRIIALRGSDWGLKKGERWMQVVINTTWISGICQYVLEFCKSLCVYQFLGDLNLRLDAWYLSELKRKLHLWVCVWSDRAS